MRIGLCSLLVNMKFSILMETHAYVQWRKFFKSPNNGFKRETWERIQKPHGHLRQARSLSGPPALLLSRAQAHARPQVEYAHLRAHIHLGRADRSVCELSLQPGSILHAHTGTCAHMHPGRASLHVDACALLLPNYLDHPSVRVDTCAPLLARVDARAKNYVCRALGRRGTPALACSRVHGDSPCRWGRLRDRS